MYIIIINIIQHNDSDHACLPSRVLKMEGADLLVLLALLIRLWFFSNIYYDFLFFINSLSLKLAIQLFLS